jgi:hypothetical protein
MNNSNNLNKTIQSILKISFASAAILSMTGLAILSNSVAVQAGRGFSIYDTLAVKSSAGANLRGSNCEIRYTLKDGAILNTGYARASGDVEYKGCTVSGQEKGYIKVSSIAIPSVAPDYIQEDLYIATDLVEVAGYSDLKVGYRELKNGKVVTEPKTTQGQEITTAPKPVDYEGSAKKGTVNGTNSADTITPVDNTGVTYESFFTVDQYVNDFKNKEVSLRDGNCQKTSEKVKAGQELKFNQTSNIDFSIYCKLGDFTREYILVTGKDGQVAYVPSLLLETN